jgi:CheY-like chemotaxis protein
MSNDIGSAVRVLLAEDDIDDRLFFQRVISSFPMADLITVSDGAQLLTYLSGTVKLIPDVIFLDLNMPKINGLECLIEIQLNEKLRRIPVIIYSTYVDEEGADELFKNGAYYYVRKRGMDELENILNHVFSLLAENKLTRPARNNFVLAL